MASYTPNYNLKKPDYSDTADIKDINNNMDKIDTALNDKVTSHEQASLLGVKINNTGAVSDVISFGGGDPDWGSGNVGGIMLTHDTRQYIIRGKGTVNGANEDFMLPVHSDGNSNRVYNILTTKDFPFSREIGVSPGGTTAGDGTNKITFTSPGANRHCLICFADKFVNIFCPSSTGTTVYSGDIPSGWTLERSGLDLTLTRSATQAFRYSLLWL